jgi:ferredoxin-NADP reductase
MLTEPFTSPRHKTNYLPYAAIVGFLYAYTKLGISPEEALLLGNIFTYVIEPNRRLPLAFAHKIQEAEGIESFVFSGKAGFKYSAGQYMEWTLSQHGSDFRGNRRYLTISSSPTEQDLMFTLKMPEKPSANSKNEFAFEGLFEEAKEYGLKTSYITKPLDKEGLQKIIPDLGERIFYLSGPYGFVHAMEKNLTDLGVKASNIKTDYFPGYQ